MSGKAGWFGNQPARDKRTLDKNARLLLSCRVAAIEFSPGFSTLVITVCGLRCPCFALKGRRILAGGETTGIRQQDQGAPVGVLDETLNYKIFHHLASVLRPCRDAKAITMGFPVVSPPANIRCPFGAKITKFKQLRGVETPG
jgi:hypothetical protein